MGHPIEIPWELYSLPCASRGNPVPYMCCLGIREIDVVLCTECTAVDNVKRRLLLYAAVFKQTVTHTLENCLLYLEMRKSIPDDKTCYRVTTMMATSKYCLW